MSRLVAETLEHMCVATWKVPDVARFKVVRLGLTGRVNHCRANPAFEHKRPFGRNCMPVKLAHSAGLESHGYTRDSLRDRSCSTVASLPKLFPRTFPFD